jgi:hypothetical protein
MSIGDHHSTPANFKWRKAVACLQEENFDIRCHGANRRHRRRLGGSACPAPDFEAELVEATRRGFCRRYSHYQLLDSA